MKPVIIAMALIATTCAAHAQSWSVESDGTVTIPPSVAGEAVSGASMVCQGGAFFLTLQDVPVGGGETNVPIAMLIDGKIFATTASTAGKITVPEAAVDVLKSGKRVTFSLPVDGKTLETTFALKGSSKAIKALTENCAPAAEPKEVLEAADAEPEKATDSEFALEALAEYPAGSQASISFKVPEKANNYWVGFIGVGASDVDYYSNGYAYTAAGNPASITVPAKPGTYEVKLADDTDKVKLVARTVTVTEPVPASIDAPDTATGGQSIQVAYSGPDGTRNSIAVAPVGASGNAVYYGQSEYTSVNPVSVRVPAMAGNYEVRYVLSIGGYNVIARRPISISEAPAVTLTAAEATAGQDFEIGLGADAPRLSGDYIYIAKPGASADNYEGGYVSIPSTGNVMIKAPDEPGEWQIRYVLPNNGGRTVVGSAPLSVK
ncbi:hypothetical protein CSC94_22505 [Zhengella mangrovi]|uniref:Uncharacterized protein n=1 Tax=Zhengella mangrovi TaxID=1982044 RepID=A0A2G1QGY2_9HYPH|nr:hypothetical protein [Zhengella mangrovi]PHP64775.1 hypothetical protein CSC94_22505 [Zhengella mangrovi]